MKLKGLLRESKASEMAHKLGLDYEGYGYWSKDGKVVAKSMNGYLVRLEKKDEEFLSTNDPLTDPARSNNKDDDWYDPDVKTISTGQYYTGGKSKSQS
ncbi:MAG: hypothetical protein KY428_07500, partial [Bacteroidetes bacterium]|nr:hypothetical protein [Bacteroidota bacterium]